MPSSNEFQQVKDRETPGAVTVRIYEFEGDAFGQVSWPSINRGDHIESPAMGEELSVPAALDRAIQDQRRLRLSRIVVYLDEGVAWSDEWGKMLP